LRRARCAAWAICSRTRAMLLLMDT